MCDEREREKERERESETQLIGQCSHPVNRNDRVIQVIRNTINIRFTVYDRWFMLGEDPEHVKMTEDQL